jgi:phosphoglycerol transferase MdoB-like AlkP superfamily enzyme
MVTFLAFWVEASTASFIGEYDSRPNYLFVEYLRYPGEVFSILTGFYFAETLAITLGAAFSGWLMFRYISSDPDSDVRVPVRGWFGLLPFVALVLLLMIRSTLDHRPVNPSIAAFSQDAMVNQLPLNSPYSLLYAIYEHRRDARDEPHRYGRMGDEEVMVTIMEEAGITGDEQSVVSLSTMHHQQATRVREKPHNLVIILQESLGAEFVHSLGGEDLMPELDKLASQGILLQRLYATGTRSARGIEAVITGFTPTNRRSVVKLAETQSGFFTLAGLLARQGYETSFIYGGESHFDNMKRFFLNNGFQRVIDEKDYENPSYLGSWGVSDEDLFQRAHEEFDRSGSQPFFSLVFTSSNHKPFDIPENRVEAVPGTDGPRKTAVRYADYALGRYFEMAAESRYWEDTVFLIIADHGVRVRGANLVPIERFRIPAVIVGAGIEPQRIPGISSQIDMLPTLLSLIGVSASHPAIGRDLTRPEYADGSGRAMMQFNALQAYLEDDRVVVLQANLEPRLFKLGSDGHLTLDTSGDRELERKALAHALWGPLMIKHQAYRMMK